MSIVANTAQPVAARVGTRPVGLRAAQFVALALQTLVVGVFWGSWLGLSRFMDGLSPATFLEVGRTMIGSYGPVMPILMPAAIVATLLAGLLARRRSPLAAFLTGAGGACLIGATAITLLVNVPIDRQIATWTVATLPADWAQIRDRWETFHTARTFVALAGFALTLAGCLFPARRAGA